MLLVRTIAVRIVTGIATLLAISAIVFVGTDLLPGDAATAFLGGRATPEELAHYRAKFDLNHPLPKRYADWFGGFVRGDLGKSAFSGDSVSSLIADRFRNTAVLTVLTLLVLIPLTVSLGILSATRPGSRFDYGLLSTTLALVAMPEFVVGTLLSV